MPVILLISYSGVLGGAERTLVDFATAVPGTLWLACPEGQLARAARDAGIRVLPLRAHTLAVRASWRQWLRAVAHLVAHVIEVRSLAESIDPDLVLAWGMRSAIACLLGRSSARPVAFGHNDILPSPMIAALVRAAAARADLVLVPSRAVAEDLDPGGRLAVAPVVVHPGVDVSRFAGDAAPVEPPEVLVLGALVGWKQPELALEVSALARKRRPDLRLRIVGGTLDADGERLRSRLRDRSNAADLEGAVELVGAVADPRTELERATCLLHCAPREPFGLAVLEALAAGRPAIVPASAGPAEIVDQSCGVLYPPGDAAAAAAAIVELVSRPELAARMGANGRKRARAQFDRAACRERFAAAVAPITRTRPARAVAPHELAVVTVTHNSAPELRRLLDSVARHLPGVRVVVVDSASSDDTLAVVRGCSAATTIGLRSNVGFGRACNAGIAALSEPVAVLLNPDVELLDDSLLGLAAEALNGERLLAPLVLDPDGSRQDTVHPVPGSGADLARTLIPPALAPGRLGVELAPWRAVRPRQVGWAVGCALVAGTVTLRRLGPFDERIFLFGEDLDLGLHAAACGVQTWFWPQARVIHHRAHSTQRAFGGEPFEQLASARRDAVARRLGSRRAGLDDASQAITFGSRIVVKGALGQPAARERRQLTALIRARRVAAGDPLADSHARW